MNKIFTKLVFFILFAFFSSTAMAQANRSPLEEVVYDIRNNKIQDLGRYFDNFVPISINNNASNYSHNQAEIVLKDFFDKNPVRDFNVVDSNSPSATSKSMIATFSSNNGKYTVYLLMKLKENSYVIKEIKISKE